MKSFPDDSEYLKFESEMDRTDRVCEAFEKVEMTEAFRKSRLPKGQKTYEIWMSGYGEVTTINVDSIEWTRPNGDIIGPICLSEEVCKDLLLEDTLYLKVGFRHKKWRLIAFESIINDVGETQVMYFDADVEVESDVPEGNDGEEKKFSI